jgi:uncharacterized integral membrane protein
MDDPGRRVNLRMISSGVLVAIILAFGIANGGRVRVDFLVVHRESRLIYVILGSALLGAVAGWLFRRSRHRE